MAATICIRESPFNDLCVTEWTRRIFTLDGKGVSTRPLHVIVVEVDTSSLSSEVMEAVSRVHNRGSRLAIEGASQPAPKKVTVLDPDVLSALDLDKWAMEYAFKFTKTHNCHATAFTLGIE
ncbi:hypothetical protein D0Z07_6088 [Hyphodiscus hymeniophilus]|uniref:Uncharacterized protein n=1 Tax=Hyphodiscus hymeniophilus TaxID=353542 RepID=A0A9P7AUR1_9HELO|nr:hypothetical protein D0Z07_6088 [Hyphodiscus hymeniophilus]